MITEELPTMCVISIAIISQVIRLGYIRTSIPSRRQNLLALAILSTTSNTSNYYHPRTQENMDLLLSRLAVTCFFLCTVTASNILMVLPLGSESHKNIFTPMAQQLGERGHDVTIVSLHASSGKQTRALAYRDVVATEAWQKIQAATKGFNVFDLTKKSSDVNKEIMKIMFRNLPEYCEAFLTDPSVQFAWKQRPDLVMLPAFMNECGLAFVHKFQVPFIYVTTSGLTPWTADAIGNPEHPAYVPNQYLPYSEDMTLWERTINSLMRVGSPIARRHFILQRLDKVVQNLFDDSSISLEEIERNASLVLVNSHHSLGYPRPLLPNVIEVGGMHCRPAKTLANVDQEVHSFLSNAFDNNVLYFSLGSHIKSSQMPENVLSKFVNVFNRLPYEVIWKWEGERPSNLSSNVLTKKWLPQQDILGHRSVGGFFTHGGLLSLQESIYHGVPVVALPLMSDQFTNAKQAESLGLGVQLSIDSLTEESIEKAIHQIMQNPSYREESMKRSTIMKDQETTPLDRALFWTQYVIRHNGAAHLKSSASKLSAIQYYLVDVAAILIPIVFIAIIVTVFTASFVFKKIMKLASRNFVSEKCSVKS